MYNIQFYNSIDFTKISNIEKNKKLEIEKEIEELLKISEDVRINGIEPLLKRIECTEDTFLKLIFRLASNGIDPFIMCKILFSIINSSKLEPKEYLKKIIQIEFAQCLRLGLDLSEQQALLTSYLGTEFIENINDYYNNLNVQISQKVKNISKETI